MRSKRCCEERTGVLKECNDLETNMVVGQIQSTAMGLLRASDTARDLLADDAKARKGRW
jgi:hypothetical protein